MRVEFPAMSVLTVSARECNQHASIRPTRSTNRPSLMYIVKQPVRSGTEGERHLVACASGSQHVVDISVLHGGACIEMELPVAVRHVRAHRSPLILKVRASLLPE